MLGHRPIFHLLFFSNAKTDQTTRMFMLGHRPTSHLHLRFPIAKTQIRLCGCICLDVGPYFTYVLFSIYCKDPDHNASPCFTYFFFFFCKDLDQTARVHMFGCRSVFHCNRLYSYLLQRPRSDCAFGRRHIFHLHLFYCKDPDQTVRLHVWTPAHISLTFILLQRPRSDCAAARLDAGTYFTYIYSIAKTQIRLCGCTFGRRHIFHLHLFYCKDPDQTVRMHVWKPAHISLRRSWEGILL